MADVYLYHFSLKDESRVAPHWADFCSWLDITTLNRLSKNPRAQRRVQSLLSKIVLYYLLNEVEPGASPQKYPLRYSPKGAPYFPDLNWKCSISYQQQWISVALATQGAVGIDLETLKRQAQFKLLPESLRQRLQERGIHHWCELEAYAKYWQEGLSIVFVSPLPPTDELSFKNYPVSSGLSCCVVTEPEQTIEQRYIMLDELIFFVNNPFTQTGQRRPVLGLNQLENGSTKTLPSGGVLTPPPKYHVAG